MSPNDNYKYTAGKTLCKCFGMCVCGYVYVYVYICMHYYRLLIKYHQLPLYANDYKDLCLQNHQQNKQKNS